MLSKEQFTEIILDLTGRAELTVEEVIRLQKAQEELNCQEKEESEDSQRD